MPRFQAPLRGLDNPENVAYVAGLIDNNGGRVTILRQTPNRSSRLAEPCFNVAVIVCTTSDQVTDWLTTHIGGGVAMSNRASNSKKWRVFGANAEALIRATRPHLTRRARQADLCLQLRDLHNLLADHAAVGGVRQAKAEVAYREALHRRVLALESNGRIPYPRGPMPKLDLDRYRRTVTRPQGDPIAPHLETHARDGIPRHVIVRRYGVNPETVEAVARRLGHDSYAAMRLAAGHAPSGAYALTPAQDATIAARYQADESVAALAREYGVSVGGIRQALARRGVPPRRQAVGRVPTLTPRQDAAIAACYLAGDSIRALARFGDVSPPVIVGALRRQSVPIRLRRKAGAAA